MISNTIQFPIILLSGAIAFILSMIVHRLSDMGGFVDHPNAAPHKLHQRATPLGGGIVLLVAIWIGWLAFGDRQPSVVPGLLLASSFIAVWGLVDDRWGLKPLPKLVGQIAGTVIMIATGLQASIFEIQWINYVITLLWMVGLTNAFNFVDSMDGLALGLGVIASGFFMLVTIDAGQLMLARLAALIAGSGFGLMFLNTRPARLFLGDSGAQLLGFILAAVGIAYNPVGLPQAASWFTPILVLGVPIFDMALVIYSRLRRRMPVYQAGRDHTYHRLVDFGFDTNRAVYGMHLLSGGLGLAAFIMLDIPALVSNFVFLGIVLSGVLLILTLEHFRNAGKIGSE